MHGATDFDDTNDHGHPVSCDCPSCMPPGADGAVEDALEAARAEVRYVGEYEVRDRRVAWTSQMGSRTDVTRSALLTAKKCLARCGVRAELPPGFRDLVIVTRAA